MRAAYVHGPGPAESIVVGELPEPTVGPTDVLVDVACTTVNPVDVLVRSGTYPVPMPAPFVVGRDLVGQVAALTCGFTVGEWVWCNSLGHGGRQGAAAERVVVPADRLYRLPDGVAPAEAVTVLHPAATAYLALFVHGGLRTGRTVLVAGGAGNVGSAAVLMAAEAGARVIVTANPRDEPYCRSLGAAEVLDYATSPELRDEVDLWVDTTGTNDVATALTTLAERGRVVLVAGAQPQVPLPVRPLYWKSCTVGGFVISRASTPELAEAAQAVNRLLAGGRLRSRRVREATLADLPTLHAAIERGDRGTRTVIHVSDPAASNNLAAR
jgi:2-desacetyl-2-hydroxyethyl bacteriochlorophyllide A dehydrogenase